MRFRIGHPDYPAFDHYVICDTTDADVEIDRMAPRQIIASAYDWPRNEYPYHGWTDALNSIWWPRGAEQFATCVVMIDDHQAELLRANVAIQVTATKGGGDLATIRTDTISALDRLSSLQAGDQLKAALGDTPLQRALASDSAYAVEAEANRFALPYRSRMISAFQDTITAIASANAVTSSDLAPRPYLVLQAMLAPREGGRAPELYLPADMEDDDVEEDQETELMAWKFYPLPPVRLPEPPSSRPHSGFWLLPLVDIRYFYRSVPLSPRTGGSVSAAATSGDFDWPLIYVDQDEDDPEWMPPLRAYPDDASAPSDYVAISDNNTHPNISGNLNWGRATDLQARMNGWRIVCRDVRSNWNTDDGDDATDDETHHTTFTGVLADYPDDATLTQRAARATVVSQGSGYQKGDILNAIGGTFTTIAKFVVSDVGANGTVLAVDRKDAGAYSVIPDEPTLAGGGSGSGCTLHLDYYSQTYHGDAIRLAGFPANIIAGGQCHTGIVQDLMARKLQFMFQVDGQDTFYNIVIYPTQEDPTSVSHLSEDTTGTGTTERTHIPKVFLGVKAGSSEPTGSHRAALVTAAKRWALLYYRWRRRQCFFKFPGIVPLIPNGHASVIRWDFAANRLETTYVAIEGIEGTDDDGCCAERRGFYACIDGEGALGDGLDGYYAFHELLDSGGTLTTKTNGRVGYVRNVNGETETVNPARSDNDKRAVPVGMQVWMKPGTPYLDVTTGEVFDHFRFTTDDLLQVIKLSLTGERNSYGHYGARIKRWNPDTKDFDDSELIWAKLLS